MWQPVDTQFYAPRTPVEIVAASGTGADPHLFRGLVESLGCTAHLHLIGTPGDFVKVISQGQAAAPYLIVSCHGGDTGLIFGEFADFIDTSLLVGEEMPASAIAERVNLPGCVVINGACGAGEAPMAEAFMSGGLAAYIGTVDPVPDDTAGPLFIAHFFYQLHRTNCGPREAWARAAAYDRDSRLYVYWDSGGCHRAG